VVVDRAIFLCYTGEMAPIRLFNETDAPVRAALRAVEARVKPDFRKAVVFVFLALVGDVVSHGAGGVHTHSAHLRWLAIGAALAFVAFGVLATRAAASELGRVTENRSGTAAATPLRVVTLLLGYLAVLLIGFDLFAVPVGHLLVGGAVTGVILGIAAQQSLGNLFAGLVLLLTRPYTPGEQIRVRSGALGGTLDGTVTSVGLTYTTMATAEGVVNIPNSALLAAAVGPRPVDSAVTDSATTESDSTDSD
jgi:small-conductance mechanosensitive channel